MKKAFLTLIPALALSTTVLVAQTKPAVTAKKAPVAAAPAKLKILTKKDSLSYAIGFAMASNLKQQNIAVNSATFQRATKDVLTGQPLSLDEATIQNVLMQFQQEMQAKANAEKSKDGEINKMAGQKFLEENKKKEGVVTLPSGLQYKIIKEGTGAKPSATDQVKTHYHGTLIDGKVFDSSVDRGEPVTFGVNQVIKGWTEALQLMPVGSKWKLFIPADLAYGEFGPPSIGPSQALIFDVELISIEPAK
ncbi:MAG: FKBP-type peptidyl-prolyl cis-trans isomerase [Opitutaceae bacterium]|nr:FKBP-type peptidyl-prolyl cis-trans isomerase [Cytophagales bacterium]